MKPKYKRHQQKVKHNASYNTNKIKARVLIFYHL